MSKIAKYLANKVKVFQLSGEIVEYGLSIVTFESEGSVIKSFSIRPFVSEEPSVIYLDIPLEIHVRRNGIVTDPQIKK